MEDAKAGRLKRSRGTGGQRAVEVANMNESEKEEGGMGRAWLVRKATNSKRQREAEPKRRESNEPRCRIACSATACFLWTQAQGL